MSVMCLFSIRDIKAGYYQKPFVARTVGEVVRSLTDAVNDKSNPNDYSKYPEDYVLEQIGTFDDDSGVLSVVIDPVVYKLINLVIPA